MVPYLLSILALGSLLLCSSFTTSARWRSSGLRRYRKITVTKNEDVDLSLTESLLKARECADAGLSPGAGLSTADEQSDAAYADLILGSMDQQGIDELDEARLRELSQAARMWEPTAKPRRSFGLLGDLGTLWTALSGGAHIVKNKYGET